MSRLEHENENIEIDLLMEPISEEHLSLVAELLKQQCLKKAVSPSKTNIRNVLMAIKSERSSTILSSAPKLRRNQPYEVVTTDDQGNKVKKTIILKQSIIKQAETKNQFEIVEHAVRDTENIDNFYNPIIGRGSFAKVKHATSYLLLDDDHHIVRYQKPRVVKIQTFKKEQKESRSSWIKRVESHLLDIQKEDDLTRRANGESDKTVVRYFIKDKDEYVKCHTYMPNKGINLDDFQRAHLVEKSLLDHLLIYRNLFLALEKLKIADIVHRDIKPENILINPDTLEITLIDFGTAKDTTTKDTVIAGTPSYMSPEHLTQKTGHKSDVYQMCLVMHQFITGREYNPYSQALQKSLPLNEEDTQYMKNIEKRKSDKNSIKIIRKTNNLILNMLIDNFHALSLSHAERPDAEEIRRFMDFKILELNGQDQEILQRIKSDNKEIDRLKHKKEEWSEFKRNREKKATRYIKDIPFPINARSMEDAFIQALKNYSNYDIESAAGKFFSFKNPTHHNTVKKFIDSYHYDENSDVMDKFITYFFANSTTPLGDGALNGIISVFAASMEKNISDLNDQSNPPINPLH